ncbi:MAG: ABC transporter permease, partial [Terriglobia bacterium]
MTYPRSYKAFVTIPPVAWVCLFLLLPYGLLFVYSFWKVSALQTILHQWNLQNYLELARNPMYVEVLLRSMRIAGSVTALALVLSYPLAYYLSFKAPASKGLLYQMVIIPLWVSYLVRAYAWKTILGSDGVLNTLLQYLHVTRHPLEFLLYS